LALLQSGLPDFHVFSREIVSPGLGGAEGASSYQKRNQRHQRFFSEISVPPSLGLSSQAETNVPKRKVYLDDIPLDEAWQRLIGALEAAGLWQPFEGEVVPLDRALGRVTAAPVWARISSPHYHASAMDGYAVRARDTALASDVTPVRLALDTQTKYVDTGDPLPAWADAVIPIEHIQLIEPETSRQPWAHDPEGEPPPWADEADHSAIRNPTPLRSGGYSLQSPTSDPHETPRPFLPYAPDVF